MSSPISMGGNPAACTAGMEQKMELVLVDFWREECGSHQLPP